MIILDGPLGTELQARHVDTALPLWSARALIEAPQVVEDIHRDYAHAGATVHTANTFRTQRRTIGEPWKELTRLAVELVRKSIGPSHLVAGSMAPLEDCYRPDKSPKDSFAEHLEFAEFLALQNVDLMLCEAFPHPQEALAAVKAAISTGLPTWLSLTAGPDASLLTVDQVRQTAAQAIDIGASAVLVNCISAAHTLPFVEGLVDLGVPFGAYANAGRADEGIRGRRVTEADSKHRFPVLESRTTEPGGPGANREFRGRRATEADSKHRFPVLKSRPTEHGGPGANCEIGWHPSPSAPLRYLAFARQWVDMGATIVGSCCGTGPAHIRLLAETWTDNL
ncbi:MAG: homocysteine S-methyltransferase family protein [Proteobacteria bacterium]|jgi:S-methylmethionine-dependent homocysteine/selenocysteine methylase|nr:homocysteine S-methyltransferase family protein [Pseudomonadota bacterium]